MNNPHDKLLIEVKAERFAAGKYVVAVMMISAVLLYPLAQLHWIDVSSSWEWLVPTAVLAGIAFLHYKRNSGVIRITESGNHHMACSFVCPRYRIEGQISSFDYWSTYSSQLHSHRPTMKLVHFLEIKLMHGDSLRVQSEDREEPIDHSLLRARDFGFTARVYTVDDVEQLVRVLKQNTGLLRANALHNLA